ncbi:MAG: hypothetical protein ACJAW4_001684 [Paracoccaceae bacterium]|jgi:hypothetical protein
MVPGSVERKGDQARVAAHKGLDFVLVDLGKIIDKGDAATRAGHPEELSALLCICDLAHAS